MKSAVKAALITVSAIALLALAGCSLYRLVVTSQIKDGDRMENPDAYRAGKELVEFEWRQNHRNYYSCFSLKFYQEDDMPLLTGWFPSQSGGDEVRKSRTDAFSDPIPWQLTWVQWFELQNALAESDLPAYKKPSSDIYDEIDSEIRIVWRTADGDETQKFSGSHAETLEALVLDIAEEAYAASKLEADSHAGASGLPPASARTADGNVRSAGCRMAVAYFAQSVESDALRKNKNKQHRGEEDLS